MRKKLFTLMTLLLTAVTGAWADGNQTLKNIDFLSTAWQAVVFDQGNTTTPDGIDNVFCYGKNSKAGKNFSMDATGLTFPDNNIASSYFIAIYLGNEITEDINGSLTVTINHTAHSSSSQALTFGYVFKADATAYNTSDVSGVVSVTETAGNTSVSFTVSGITKTKGVLYLGPNNSSTRGTAIKWTGITITTPKTISSQEFYGVKVDGTLLTANASTNGYSVDVNTITLSDDITTTSAPTNITITNLITYTDSDTSTENVDVTFDGTKTAGYFIGTATIGETVYTVRVKEDVAPNIALTSASGNISLTSYTTIQGSVSTTLSGSHLTPGTYTVTAPNVTIEPAEFTVAADGSIAATEFTITSTASTAAITDIEFSDGTTATTYNLSYSKPTKRSVTQTDVTASTTWDWSKAASGDILLTKIGVDEATVNTDPVRGDAFLMATLPEVTNDATFNSQALMLNTQYVYRNNNGKYMQGNSVSFNVTKPGTVTVTFANTGNRSDSEGNRRYLYINGTNTEVYSLRQTDDGDNIAFKDATMTVPSGKVVINAFTGNGAETMVRISKIVYTANDALEQESIEIACEGGLASFSCDKALDFSTSSAKAYIVTATTSTSATLQEVKKVPANTGLIIKGTKDETINVLTTTAETEDMTDNKLKASGSGFTVNDATMSVYALSKTDGLFHKVSDGAAFPANRAYLDASEAFLGGGAPSVIGLDFESNSDMTTGISTIEHPTLNIEHSEFYNLNGQRVSQPAKGLYIVNGRKVVIK